MKFEKPLGLRNCKIKRHSPTLDAAWLRELYIDVGADDVGFVDVERPAVSRERESILRLFPHTKKNPCPAREQVARKVVSNSPGESIVVRALNARLGEPSLRVTVWAADRDTNRAKHRVSAGFLVVRPPELLDRGWRSLH